MRQLRQDLRHGARVWRRKPLITTAVLLSLILGLGTNAAIFTLLDALFLRPIPAVEGLDRLAYVYMTDRDNPDPTAPQRWSYRMAERLSEEVDGFTSLAYRQRVTVGLRSAAGTERITAATVTANYFDTLGLTTAHGRFFSPEEDLVPGPEPVAVLSHDLWQRLYDGDESVVGRDIEVNGLRFRVVGVGPRRFQGPDLATAVEMWLPIGWFPEVSPFGRFFDDPIASIFDVVGHLAPDRSLAAVNAEVAQVGDRLEEEFDLEDANILAGIQPLRDVTIVPRERERFRTYARILVIAVGLVLLLAMINVGHLLLVHGLDRAPELAARQALGASRGRLVRQLLTETLLLFLVGGVLAWGAAWALVRFLWSQRPPELAANTAELQPDGRVLLFLLVLTVLSGLVAGALPALRASRVDLVSRLKGADPLTGGRRRFDVHDALVIPQLSLALAAVIAGGLFFQVLGASRSQDLGFEPDPLAVVTVYPTMLGYQEDETRAFYDELLRRVRDMPEVESAALGSDRLLRGGVIRHQIYRPGEDVPAEGDSRDRLRTTVVSSGFFDTAGLRMEGGRDFGSRHEADSPPSVIVNRFAVDHYLGGGAGVDEALHFDNPHTPSKRILAVTDTAQYRYIGEEPQGFVYIPMGQLPASDMILHVKTRGSPEALLPRLRDQIRALDPDMPYGDLATMEYFLNEALWLERSATTLFNAFGLLALVLAAIGVYGVIRHGVRRRIREVAVRLAVGAQRSDIVGRFLRHGARVAVVGLGLGLLVGIVVVRPWVASTVAEAPGAGWGVFLLPTLGFFVVVLLATWLPARRAARIDPARTFRDA